MPRPREWVDRPRIPLRRLAPIGAVLAMIVDLAGAAVRPDSLEGAGDGRRRLSEDRLWQRRISIRELEEQNLRTPDDVRVLGRLAQAYLDAGFLTRARDTFERQLQLVPDDADALFGLGRIHQRGWLASPDSGSAGAALDYYGRAVQARPDFWEAWIALAVLRFERKDPRGGRAAALNAMAAMPDRVEVQITNAYLAYRNGVVALADSLFSVAIPRLPAGIAARFDDISPLLGAEDRDDFGAFDTEQRADRVRQYWNLNDPDPTTVHNEARLEFYSRLAHAMMLLRDPWSMRWYGRTEFYARYGSLVQIEDPFDSEHDEMPRVGWGEVAVTPTPQALAKLGMLTTHGGTAVFSPLPPGTRELPLQSLVARFEGERGSRLVAHVEAHGALGDSLAADCVVLDSLRQVVARASESLSPSACDPAERRLGGFAFDLEPGRYEVAFAVYDKLDGRGTSRAAAAVEPAPSSLSISDVVLQCGPAALSTGAGGIRLNPNFMARVEGNQHLTAYFEIYRLQPDSKGGNRFEYEYTVRLLNTEGPSSRRLKRSAAEAASRLAFSSEQSGVGTMRRQFISVPTQSLPAGRYRLTILVRDNSTGTKAKRTVDFVKAGKAPSSTN